MDLSKDDEKRLQFRKILKHLAYSETLLRDSKECDELYQDLENIYHETENEKEFRHYYSDIFLVLSEIHSDIKLGSIEVLEQNLRFVLEGYQENKNKDSKGKNINISKSLFKLYDHVRLDIARMIYSDAGDRQITIDSDLTNIKSNAEKLGTKIAKTEESLKNSQREYITILGIFAAIVLAFTGGIAFSTSVFENLHLSSIYRIVVVSSIIGLVLINTLYALFYYVDRLVNAKSERKIKPLTFVNIIFIIIIIFSLIAWSYGLVEKRSKIISDVEEPKSFINITFLNNENK